MDTLEVVHAVVQERMRQAAAIEREHQARTLARGTATPRSGLSQPRQGRLPLPSFMTRLFPKASAP
jgi:hypothetical protein